MSVVEFHFRIGLTTGGFAGVDVFFVISGYLISSGIMRNIQENNFSFLQFYQRRIFRLMPALLVTCLITAIGAWWWLLPPDFAAFGRSLISSVFAAANFYFWKQSGYFAPESQSQPLLHLWSLGIEEQFYFLMPAALLLISRWCKPYRLLLITLALVGSLAACIGAAFVAPAAGFYLLPCRAWELLAGAFLAMAVMDKGWLPPTRLWREIAGGAGLALIVGSMLTLRETDVFPAWNAIAPCLGAGLVIWAGTGTDLLPLANRALSWSPFRFIGNISYSFYLVHWPIAAFWEYRLMRPPTMGEGLALVALSIILATLIWQFFEQPGRRKTAVPAQRLAIIGSAAAVLVALGLGMATYRVPQRFTDFALVDNSGQGQWGGPHCFNESLSRPIDWDRQLCTRTRGKSHRVLLWGDSFAAHYTPGLIRDAGHRDAEILQYTFAGCPPILAYNSLSRVGCQVSNGRVPDMVTQLHIDTVVIAAKWTDAPKRTLARLHETVAALKARGANVYVIGQTPEFVADVQRVDYVGGRHNAPEGQWPIAFDPAINTVLKAQSAQAIFIDPLAALCHGMQCPYRRGKTWLYADYGHFSPAGSQWAAETYFPLRRQ